MIMELLEKNQAVFKETSDLPPVKIEHSIRFISGTRNISVKPYEYPHAHMEAIEKFVFNM